MPKVLDFYNLVASKLAAEGELADQWIEGKHWGAVGASREAALRRFIRSCLPDRLVCGTGFIVSEDDELSRQCDLLIYERDLLAPLFVEEDFVVVRADAVRLVIEAKSGVGADVFRTALNNVRCAKRLHAGIRGAIFGLKGPPDADILKGWLDDVAENGVPGPASEKEDNDELPDEHLVDFVHFASGLQMHAWHDDQDGSLRVGAREAASNDGKALLYWWDWILMQCRPEPVEGGASIPGVLEFLRLPAPEWPELMTYESTF